MTRFQEILTTIAQGLVDELDASFARIWLLGPVDLCSDCYKADICRNHEKCRIPRPVPESTPTSTFNLIILNPCLRSSAPSPLNAFLVKFRIATSFGEFQRAGFSDWGGSAADLQAFPSHLTDLLNKTVACMNSASYLKTFNSFYFMIYQIFKARLLGQIAFGTKIDYYFFNDYRISSSAQIGLFYKTHPRSSIYQEINS